MPQNHDLDAQLADRSIRALEAEMEYRQRVFAAAGGGKSTLLGMLARHAQADAIVIALIGERGREVKEFVDHILGEEGMRRAVVVADADGERSLQAKLVVGADGTASMVREALGIAVDRHDFQQTLLVARLRTSQAPDGTAYERFTDSGPTALLPRGDRHYGVVHGVPSGQAAAVAALDEAGWLARIQQAFGVAAHCP